MRALRRRRLPYMGATCASPLRSRTIWKWNSAWPPRSWPGRGLGQAVFSTLAIAFVFGPGGQGGGVHVGKLLYCSPNVVDSWSVDCGSRNFFERGRNFHTEL